MISSDLPEGTTGSRIALCLVLLRMGFTCAPAVTGRAVVSYTAFPPFPLRVVYFCCTGLGVASTGRYPASCPVKPGLSSAKAAIVRLSRSLSYIAARCAMVTKRHSQPAANSYALSPYYTGKMLPPTNSLTRELLGMCSVVTARKYSRNFSSLLAS